MWRLRVQGSNTSPGRRSRDKGTRWHQAKSRAGLGATCVPSEPTDPQRARSSRSEQGPRGSWGRLSGQQGPPAVGDFHSPGKLMGGQAHPKASRPRQLSSPTKARPSLSPSAPSGRAGAHLGRGPGAGSGEGWCQRRGAGWSIKSPLAENTHSTCSGWKVGFAETPSPRKDSSGACATHW